MDMSLVVTVGSLFIFHATLQVKPRTRTCLSLVSVYEGLVRSSFVKTPPTIYFHRLTFHKLIVKRSGNMSVLSTCPTYVICRAAVSRIHFVCTSYIPLSRQVLTSKERVISINGREAYIESL